MLLDQARLLIDYCLRPLKAPSNTLDRGQLVPAMVLAALIALLLQMPAHLQERSLVAEGEEILEQLESGSTLTEAQEARLAELGRRAAERHLATPSLSLLGRIGGISASAFRSLFLWGAVFVPVSLALLSMIEGRGRTGLCVQQNFSGLLCCILYAWSAAHLPSALLQSVAPWFPLVSLLYFLVLAGLCLRSVLGSQTGAAFAAVLGGTVLTAGCGYLSLYLGGLVYLLASPCLLYYLWGSVATDFSRIGGGLGRQRVSGGTWRRSQ